MTALPVIIRELREESRRPSTYWLRMMVALATLTACATTVYYSSKFGYPLTGDGLFWSMAKTLFFAIFLIVPLIAADSISREVRENTLQLLFLTPLTPSGIIIGKSGVHLLRALTALTAILPFLAIPILMGGVGADIYIGAAIVCFCVVLLALSAGILGSVSSKDRLKAMICAEFYSMAILGVALMWPQIIGELIGLNSFAEFLALSAAISIGVFVFVLEAAIIRIRNFRTERPPSAAEIEDQELWVAPRFFMSHYQRSMNRKLDANPIKWLHNRSWKTRTTKWGWLLIIMIVNTWFVCIAEFESLYRFQMIFGLIMTSLMAFSATTSFLQEKESGALELLLVTPISASKVLFGRASAIWEQFLFSALFIMLVAWHAHDVFTSYYFQDELGFIFLIIAVAFVTTPFIGIFSSLWTNGVVGALGLTIGLSAALPAGLGLIANMYVESQYYGAEAIQILWMAVAAILIFQIFSGFLFGHFAHRKLQRRTFEVAS